MSEENYLRINQDGTMEAVYVTSEPRDIQEAIINKMSSKVTRSCERLFLIDDQPAGVVFSDKEAYAFVRLNKISINTSYRLGADKILRPVFLNKNNPAEELNNPVFPAVWKPVGGMRVYFAARISDYQTDQPYTHHSHACFLIAYDHEKRAYRLPLPNLYDNCDLCMGTFDGHGSSLQSAFMKAFEQLDKSKWNSDLLDDSRNNGSALLFQFKAKKDTIEQVPIPEGFDWRKVCPKIATPVTDIIRSAI